MDKLKEIWQKNWKQYAVWLLIVAALWVLYAVGFNQGFNPPSPPVPIFQPDEFKGNDGTYEFGWKSDPEAVAAIVQGLPFKAFADTPAGAVEAIPDHFYQWEVWKKQDPRGPPTKNQGSVGSCVSFGTNNAIARTMMCQIVMNQANEEFKDIAEEVTYAGSRVEIGKGRISGDGSVGAWAAQFVQKWGVVAREVHGKYDLTKYDQARCRAWGRTGVPDDLEPTARNHPVSSITQIKTLDELKKALSQGYGVAVCSDQGFAYQRDARGVARAQGSWAHCMCIDGYHTDEAGKVFFHIENSWGDKTHTGPTGWGNPSTAGFWAEAAVVQRMLNAGDTWAFSGVRGFPARESIWFVQQKQREADVRLAFNLTPKKRLDPCALLTLCP